MVTRLPVLLGLSAAALFALSAAADEKRTDEHAGHFDSCSKACADCMRECESCMRHCADLAVGGKKDHVTTMGTCADCAEFCAAAKITAHRGPMAGLMCESCAKACDKCGAECEKFPNDEHMARCARACRDCAKACREMLKHTGQESK